MCNAGNENYNLYFKMFLLPDVYIDLYCDLSIANKVTFLTGKK